MKTNDLEFFKQNSKEAASLLKKICHPDRLLVLCHLSEGELSAGELARRSTLSLSAFSQHLAILREANLVNVRRDGQTLFYSILDIRVLQLLNSLKEIFCPEHKE